MEEVLDRAGKGTGVYRLEGLPYGRYTVQETKAPEGYELNQAIFEVNITEEKTYVVQADGFEGIPNRRRLAPLPCTRWILRTGLYLASRFCWSTARMEKIGIRSSFGRSLPPSCLAAAPVRGLKDGALTTGRMEWQYFPAWRLP